MLHLRASEKLSDVPGGGIGFGDDDTFADPLLINVHSCDLNCGGEPFKDLKVYESEVRLKKDLVNTSYLLSAHAHPSHPACGVCFVFPEPCNE